MADRLVGLRPYVRRGVDGVRTACELTAELSYRRALVQLDRFHVHRQLGRAFGLHTPGYRKALIALCRGELGTVRSLPALRGVGEWRGVCQEVREYLERHRSVLWTHHEWEARTTVRKMGSGVMEKTIETVINRRWETFWSGSGP